MIESSARRARALPDWSAVPGSSEDDRVFLNQRIAFLGKVFFSLSIAFLAVNVASEWALDPESRGIGAVASLDTLLHLVAAGASGAQWLACRGGRRSSPALNALDIGGLVGAMTFYGLQSASSPPGFEQALVMATITLALVTTRAIIVPSTARRTFWLSLVACAPALCVAYLFVAPPAELVAHPWMRQKATVYVASWCAVAVAIATLASRVIFGLARRVREATELGQYTLEEKLGEGGMGVVYRARHAMLRRPTAIKLLHADAGGQALARFEREVQLTSSLTHPNTIAVYDYGRTPDGVFYYAMEYLDGINLEDLVVHDGPQPPARVVHLLKQAAGALAEAHRVRLIHRDIKPANLMLCARGDIPDFVKVLDFGLVKDFDRGADPDVSVEGALVGTPLYLSPEAIVGAEALDARADLYALGAVAYFLLAGKPPFEGKSLLEICSKHVLLKPPPLSPRSDGSPSSLEALVLRCLAKTPAERPASAAELIEHLGRCDDVAPWTDADARLWWTEAAPDVVRKVQVARRARVATSLGGAAPTVLVDFGHRAVAG